MDDSQPDLKVAYVAVVEDVEWLEVDDLHERLALNKNNSRGFVQPVPLS